MSKTVVLAEKPSVARDIARVLKCGKKENGYLEGDQYIVTWALGHLVTLADPEAYDAKFKAWKLEDLPMLPNETKLVVIKQTGKQYNAVKAQLTRKDVKEIVIATDAGREGELVARWILEKARIQKPIKRLWISSVTDKAIKEGFSRLRNGKEYENLYYSAVARAEADWVVGMNATRALTTKYNAQLSCGRVQTPTLAMIAKREEEIQSFVPKEYYGMKALTEKGFQLVWQDAKTKERRNFNKSEIERLYGQVKNKQGTITEISKAEKKSYAPALYDLTELQRDANRIFGYSAKETLSILQRLYEQYKIVTYPRTDSRFISTDMVDTLKERVEAVRAHSYKSVASKILSKPIKGSKSFVNNEKVTDHHAIIPTEETVLLSKLSDKEYKIYDLIVKTDGWRRLWKDFAQSYFDRGDFARAAFKLEGYLPPAEKDCEAHLMNSWCALYLKGPGRGLEEFARLADRRLCPADRVGTGRGVSLLYLNRLDEAEKELEKASRANPENVRATVAMGAVAFLKGRYEKAIEIYNRNITRLPKEEKYFSWPSHALNNLGWSYIKTGRYQDALLTFQKLESLHRGRKYPEILDGTGWSLFHLDRLKEARAAFDQALLLNPKYGSSLSGLSAVDGRTKP